MIFPKFFARLNKILVALTEITSESTYLGSFLTFVSRPLTSFET